MQPLRTVVEDAPEMFLIPPEYRHRRLELIIWPLDEQPIQVSDPPVMFRTMMVERVIMPSREERYER
jgi:hypothetical protein